MKWTQWYPDQAGALRALGMLALFIAAFAAITIYLPDLQRQRARARFGHDWDCVAQAKGDPVCIRRVGR